MKTYNRNLLGIGCLVFVFLFGCASFEKKPAKKYVPKPRIEREGEVRKEVIRPEPRPFVTSSTPRSKASAKMVDEGRALLNNAQFETAERKFQDAIGIDPDNGIAYYYLAKSKYEQGEGEQALGVLDKAEGLLAGSKEWLEAIKELREMIKTEIR